RDQIPHVLLSGGNPKVTRIVPGHRARAVDGQDHVLVDVGDRGLEQLRDVLEGDLNGGGVGRVETQIALPGRGEGRDRVRSERDRDRKLGAGDDGELLREAEAFERVDRRPGGGPFRAVLLRGKDGDHGELKEHEDDEEREYRGDRGGDAFSIVA